MKVILEIIALLFLTAGGYSIGAVLSGRIGPVRVPNPSPGAVDTLLVGALWAGSIAIRLKIAGRWVSFGLAVIVAFLFGYVLQRVRQRSAQGEGCPDSHRYENTV